MRKSRERLDRDQPKVTGVVALNYSFLGRIVSREKARSGEKPGEKATCTYLLICTVKAA